MTDATVPCLSKSLYICGIQCGKALWMQKHHPELKDEPSDRQQTAFDCGTSVGILAQQLFPGGVEVPYNGLTPAEQLAMTQRLMAEGVNTIYEAAFSFQNTFCKVDILNRGTEGWELYEVKASTGCKDVYLDDIALQFYLLTGCGLQPAKAFLVHLNADYVRNGAIDPEQLFTRLDLSGEVSALQDKVGQNLTRLRELIKGDMPAIPIGPHCDSPYTCRFSGHCWSHIPENSVFAFRGHGRPDAWKLYNEGYLKIADVPEEQLGWRQKLQQRGVREEFLEIEREGVRTFLEQLHYPLSFMDFETYFTVAVPLWDGTHPYQQVPFQFSLHVMDSPCTECQHHEFLAAGNCDPRLLFLEALLAALPENGHILGWYTPFEATRLRELAETFPDYRSRIDSLLERVVDLMTPFRNKQIYHSGFNGSYSLKSVLPALVPELSYTELAISNGEMATSAWLAMRETDNREERETLSRNLLAYCKLDTLALVKILGRMRELAALDSQRESLAAK